MGQNESEKNIEAAMAHIHPIRLKNNAKKLKRLKFNLTDDEFDSMRDVADALELSIADYLFALHRYALPRLKHSDQEGDWVHTKKHKRDED